MEGQFVIMEQQNANMYSDNLYLQKITAMVKKRRKIIQGCIICCTENATYVEIQSSVWI